MQIGVVEARTTVGDNQRRITAGAGDLVVNGDSIGFKARAILIVRETQHTAEQGKQCDTEGFRNKR